MIKETRLTFYDTEALRAKAITKDINSWNKENSKKGIIPINEIFPTYEGEGRNIGTPRIFIRVQGCSVGCSHCDSKHTWHVKKADVMSIKEVIRTVDKYSQETGITSVSVTGGEPMQFPKPLTKLVKGLKKAGYEINMETSGLFFSPDIFAYCDSVSMDVKTPDSGVVVSKQLSKVLKASSYLMQDRLHLKFIVNSEKDLDFIKKAVSNLNKNLFVTLTPCLPEEIHDSRKDLQDHIDKANMLLQLIMNSGLLSNKNINVIVQQHKLMNFR